MGIFSGMEKVSGTAGAVTIAFKASPVLMMISEQLDILKTLSVTVGYQGRSGLAFYPGKDRINVATVAMFHVFGTEDIPKRDFMRSALEVGRGQMADVIAREIGLVATGQKTALDAMSAIGEFAAELIVKRIDSAGSWAKPLDPGTTKEKGSSKPLNATGLLRDSVTWAVRKGAVGGSVIREGKPN